MCVWYMSVCVSVCDGGGGKRHRKRDELGNIWGCWLWHVKVSLDYDMKKQWPIQRPIED